MLETNRFFSRASATASILFPSSVRAGVDRIQEILRPLRPRKSLLPLFTTALLPTKRALLFVR